MKLMVEYYDRDSKYRAKWLEVGEGLTQGDEQVLKSVVAVVLGDVNKIKRITAVKTSEEKHT